MFLFAKLVMENLLAQEQQERLLEEIGRNRFPTGIQQAYVELSPKLFPCL